jgi:hypothetical protein
LPWLVAAAVGPDVLMLREPLEVAARLAAAVAPHGLKYRCRVRLSFCVNRGKSSWVPVVIPAPQQHRELQQTATLALLAETPPSPFRRQSTSCRKWC